jgi:hypothetical protein
MRAALIVLLVLAVPATAHAGGWATVELDELPAGVRAGEPLRMELLVKQHGITPMAGLKPTVRIEGAAGQVREFPARPIPGRSGWYAAEVVYPTAGEWRTRLFDGFTNAVPHRIPPLTVAAGGGPAAVSPPADAFPWPQAVALLVVALGLLAGSVALREPGRARGGRRPAPGAVAGGPAAGS